jgi:hypothetical protein
MHELLMELGVLLLSTILALPLLVLLINRTSSTRRKSKIWDRPKIKQRRHAVGPCAVAVGVYKAYEDRKQLEKMYSDDT